MQTDEVLCIDFEMWIATDTSVIASADSRRIQFNGDKFSQYLTDGFSMWNCRFLAAHPFVYCSPFIAASAVVAVNTFDSMKPLSLVLSCHRPYPQMSRSLRQQYKWIEISIVILSELEREIAGLEAGKRNVEEKETKTKVTAMDNKYFFYSPTR